MIPGNRHSGVTPPSSPSGHQKCQILSVSMYVAIIYSHTSDWSVKFLRNQQVKAYFSSPWNFKVEKIKVMLLLITVAKVSNKFDQKLEVISAEYIFEWKGKGHF